MELASNGEISQDWHKYEKCPEGTVPIRRSTSSITRKHPSLLRRHFNSSLVQSPKGIHEYALVRSKDNQYYGATATLSVWKPKVEVNELSLAQLWISSGYGVNLNTIEVGWMRDYYTTTGCYDIDCPGFVQTNFNIQLGHPIPISTVGGPTCAIRIMVYKDGKNGNWWLDYNGVDIGYFPKNLFTSLSEYAQRVDFGGEIVNKENEGHHTTTQMGNGLYPHETGASFITGIKLYGRDRKPVKGNILQPIRRLYFQSVRGKNEGRNNNVYLSSTGGGGNELAAAAKKEPGEANSGDEGSRPRPADCGSRRGKKKGRENLPDDQILLPAADDRKKYAG
ncbi:uncharacterized protein LOC124943710 [Impatiens glandulifera]|uniref:uncharacterized protein LOC124943710 n=1 Tax=Impatiens glandulifera TaxID=253017 RepID=UPI001FB1058A|nr:uncharacterized protein LOC124943710 [Impatiens glandulifera]